MWINKLLNDSSCACLVTCFTSFHFVCSPRRLFSSVVQVFIEGFSFLKCNFGCANSPTFMYLCLVFHLMLRLPFFYIRNKEICSRTTLVLFKTSAMIDPLKRVWNINGNFDQNMLCLMYFFIMLDSGFSPDKQITSRTP